MVGATEASFAHILGWNLYLPHPHNAIDPAAKEVQTGVWQTTRHLSTSSFSCVNSGFWVLWELHCLLFVGAWGVSNIWFPSNSLAVSLCGVVPSSSLSYDWHGFWAQMELRWTMPLSSWRGRRLAFLLWSFVFFCLTLLLTILYSSL